MRVISEFSIHSQRYTLLKHDYKYTLRIEDGNCEQVYKLGDLGSEFSPHLLKEQLLSAIRVRGEITSIFKDLSRIKLELAGLNKTTSKDDFDEII